MEKNKTKVPDLEGIPWDLVKRLEDPVYHLLVAGYQLGRVHVSEDLVEELELADIFPQKALTALFGKTPMLKEDFYALDAQARQKAFTVAAASSVQTVAQVRDRIAEALTQLPEPPADIPLFIQKIRTDGLVQGAEYYWENVYRTNVQNAYNAGRWSGFIRNAHEIEHLTYISILDTRTTDECRDYDGITRPADDPIWDTITPPNHFQCRSTVRAIWKRSPEAADKQPTPDQKVQDILKNHPPMEGFEANPAMVWYETPSATMKTLAELGGERFTGEVQKRERKTERAVKKKEQGPKIDPNNPADLTRKGLLQSKEQTMEKIWGQMAGDATEKARVMKDLAKRLEKSRHFQSLVKEFKARRMLSGFGDNDTERAVSALIEKWAGTSGDESPLAITMQILAQKEFKLRGASMAHLMKDEGAWRTANELVGVIEKGGRRFLREQYRLTQEYLRSRGIKEVYVYRGMGISYEDLKRDAPDLHKRMHEWTQETHAGTARYNLQPVSSFSTDQETGQVFTFYAGEGEAPALLVAKIPAKRVIGLPGTGYGCLREYEMAVLSNGPENWFGLYSVAKHTFEYRRAAFLRETMLTEIDRLHAIQ